MSEPNNNSNNLKKPDAELVAGDNEECEKIEKSDDNHEEEIPSIEGEEDVEEKKE